MQFLRIVMSYFRKHQTAPVRFFHITVLTLVIFQIISSNFMGFTSRGEIKTNLVDFYGTWTHIITGLSLLPVAFAFIYIEIKTHGFNYFFKYLSGDFSQVKKDISVMKQRQLPEANPNSIASIVQGLGLGALTLVLLSGCAWFVSWIYDAPWVKISKEIHQSLTGLIQAYVVAHGFMGLLHIYMASKK